MHSPRNLFIMINPAAGKEEPVEELIKKTFRDSGSPVTVHVLAKTDDPAEIARRAGREADLVAVYGGDGSITQAAEGLIGTQVPMAVIPGGTANVLSKELGIAQDTETTLEMLRDGRYELRTIDTAEVNGRPFLLRVNLGVMAEMITCTDPELKEQVGQLAYGLATIKSLQEAEPVDYLLHIDGQRVKASGVALTVTNAGSIGIGGLQLQPGIDMGDGLLDILLLKSADLLSVVKVAGSSLLGRETNAVRHWKGREIHIEMPEAQTYLCDDCEADGKTLSIRMVPASLILAVPQSANA